MATNDFINECKNPAYMNRYGKLVMKKPHYTSINSSIPLTISDSVESPIKELKLEGKTTQKTTTGKNIFKNTKFSGTLRGLNIVNDGEKITVSGTTSAEYYPCIIMYADGSYLLNDWWATNARLLPEKGYFNSSTINNVISILTSGTSTNRYDIFVGRETSFSQDSFTISGTYTKQVESNSEKINFIAIGFSPNKAYNLEFKIQIENGLTPTSYEPYTNGASPNPDYPSELKSLGYQNLLIEEYEQGNSMGSNNYKRIRSKNLIPIVEGTTYTLSWSGTNASNYMYVINTSSTKSSYPFTTYMDCGNSDVWTLNSPISFTATHDGYLSVVICKNDNSTIIPSDFTNVNLMVVDNGQAHDYIPYGKYGIELILSDGNNTSKYLYQLNEPLRSIETVKDLLYIKDNYLFVQRKIRHIERNISDMDNSENFPGWNDMDQLKIDYPNINSTFTTMNIPYKSNINNEINAFGLNTNNANKVMWLPGYSYDGRTQTQWTTNYPDLVLKLDYGLSTPEIEKLGEIDMPSTYENITYINIMPNNGQNFEISYGDSIIELNESNVIQNFTTDDGCYDDGNIIGTVYSKKINVQLIDALDKSLENESFLAKVGIKYDNNSLEYINLGKYTIEKPKDELIENYTSFVAYDDLLNNLDQKYECGLDYKNETITLTNLYQDVCNNLGLTPKTLSFINNDIPISNNPFTNNETNRFVLQTISKIAASFVTIDLDDNEIDLSWLSSNTNPDYVFTKDDYSTLDGGKVKYGPVNSLIIKSDAVDSENVSKSDDLSIVENGEHQIIISDDYILNTSELRQQALQSIWSRVHGLEYVDCTLTTSLGKPFLKIGNKIRVYTDENEYIDTYVLQHQFTFNGAYISVIKSPVLTKQEVITKQDISLGEKLRQTEIIVNKQEGTISSYTSKTDNLITKQDNDYLELKTKFNDYVPQSTYATLEHSVETLQTDTYTKTEINTKLTDGSVTKVHSVSGTFDENGMTYEKTNAATNTTINEVGVNTKNATTNESILFAGYVDNNNTQFADYKGQTIVATQNIIVKNYLIMPEAHSRIEKYGNGGGMFHV